MVLNGRSQIDKHIMNLERENILMRGMLQDKGINVQEEIGGCETLYVREKDNKNLLSESERMRRTMEAMMMVFRTSREQMEAVKSYVRT